MNPEGFIEVANAWHGAGGTDGYEDVKTAARELLPPQLEACVAVKIDGVPTALVLADESLFLVSAAPGEGDRATVTVRREPLDPMRTTVEVAQSWETRGPASDLVHRWRFTRDGTEFLALEARQQFGTMDRGVPAVGVFAQALAERVGWPRPQA